MPNRKFSEDIRTYAFLNFRLGTVFEGFHKLDSM